MAESAAAALNPGSADLALRGCPDAFLGDQREYMMGIDEAGRGPTLGPMVYGSAFCAVEDEKKLRAMGFNDSKQLTEAKRMSLWGELQTNDFIGWRIRVLEAKEIAAGMLRKHTKYNLNAMSHDAAIGLVQGVIATGVNLRYLYVDTVGDPERYQAKLAELFPSLQVVVEKKADATYPIVSAASICAKVPRDLILQNWEFEDASLDGDREWGCGYPSDEHTKRWMKANLHPVFGWPDLVRFSWGPAKEVMDKEPGANGAAVVLWADDDEGDGAAVEQQRSAMAAFLGKAKKQKVADRHRWLHEAQLEPVDAW